MATEIAHEGTVKFWSGKFITLCGLTFPTSRRAGWFTRDCPDCVRIKKQRKKAKS